MEAIHPIPLKAGQGVLLSLHALRQWPSRSPESAMPRSQLGEGASLSNMSLCFNFVSFQGMLIVRQSTFSTVTQTCACVLHRSSTFSWCSLGIMICRILPCVDIFAMNFNCLPILKKCSYGVNMNPYSQLYLAICLYLAIKFIASYTFDTYSKHNKGGG